MAERFAFVFVLSYTVYPVIAFLSVLDSEFKVISWILFLIIFIFSLNS